MSEFLKPGRNTKRDGN